MNRRASPAVMDAVLPLIVNGDGRRDLDRAVLQGRTLRHFFSRDEMLRVHVVGRGEELPRISEALKPLETPWLRYFFRDERDVDPRMTDSQTKGWHKQQIIKMAAPEWLGAPFWLTLDADVICVRPVCVSDLLPDGRALLDHVRVSDVPIFERWADGTRVLLGMVAPPLSVSMSITPLIYARPAMQAAFAMIEFAHGRPWKDVLLDRAIVGQIEDLGFHSWAEQHIYYLAAVRAGLLGQCHAISGIDVSACLIQSGIWTENDWKTLDVRQLADTARPGFFFVCSSYTGMPVERAEAVVESVLGQAAADSPPSKSLAHAEIEMLDAEAEAGRKHDGLRVRIVSKRPLILMGPADTTLSSVLAAETLASLRETPATVLLTLPFVHEDPRRAASIAARIARRRRESPRHQFVVLCNTEAELALFEQLGVGCRLVSHNSFIDERPFCIDPPGEPEFDAVYNAGFHPLKRHYLAAEVRSLALIFADWHDAPDNVDYARESRKALSHAAFLNESSDGRYRFFDRAETARHLSRARVGLCLSEYEGTMRASIEYLYAGLPVVTTWNIGGRDLFFDADFCATVPPSPDLVAAAVDALVARGVSRGYVRRRTMHKIAPHRERYIECVMGVLHAMGAERSAPVRWPWLDSEVYGFLTHAALRESLA